MLSASVCSHQGKALVSRQFVEMNRLRVEGLLAAFPKLISGDSNHTFVETDSVRYVYQPLENNLYLLLVTTKTSNIVQDLGTLRLLAKVVPDICGGLLPDQIHSNAFDLIFAFDEVLTSGGYPEDTQLSAIRTNLIMDSHEEKVFLALQKSKEDEAKATMAAQAKSIQNQKMQQLRNNMMNGGNGGMPGMGSGMEGFGGGGYGQAPAQAPEQQDYSPYHTPAPAAPAPPKVLAKSGMVLGGAKGGMGGGGLGGLGGAKKDVLSAMAKEDNLFGDAAGAFGLGAAPAPAPNAVPSTPLTVVAEEKVTCNMNREGVVETAECKGTLTLTANTDAGSTAQVTIDKSKLSPQFTVSTHPKVDKKTYESSGVLTLKGNKPLPVSRGVGLLRWSNNSPECAPLTINCWPEDEGGSMNVNVELELTNPNVTLTDVNILLPLGTTDAPVIADIDGVYKHDPHNAVMCWHFDVVDAANNANASLEFSIPGADPDAFFPVQVMFSSQTLQCPIPVVNIAGGNGAGIPHDFKQTMVADQYTCQ